jgi:hypothetical protein
VRTTDRVLLKRATYPMTAPAPILAHEARKSRTHAEEIRRQPVSQLGAAPRRVERAESRSRPALDAALLSPLVRASEGQGPGSTPIELTVPRR